MNDETNFISFTPHTGDDLIHPRWHVAQCGDVKATGNETRKK